MVVFELKRLLEDLTSDGVANAGPSRPPQKPAGTAAQTVRERKLNELDGYIDVAMTEDEQREANVHLFR